MKIWACSMILAAGAAMAEPVQVIERFDSGADGRWRYVEDGVMGGVSTGAAQVDGQGLHLSGQVSTKNNGGFIQARRDLPEGLPAGVETLVLNVRGNGARYTIFLRTKQGFLPWHNYTASFVAGEAWSEVRLPLAEFERSAKLMPKTFVPSDVESIGIAAYGADYEADLWVNVVGVE